MACLLVAVSDVRVLVGSGVLLLVAGMLLSVSADRLVARWDAWGLLSMCISCCVCWPTGLLGPFVAPAATGLAPGAGLGCVCVAVAAALAA